MMNKLRMFFMGNLLVLILLTLTGCQTNIAGVYTNNTSSNITLVLNEDNTFTMTEADFGWKLECSGTYTVDGQTINLKDSNKNRSWSGTVSVSKNKVTSISGIDGLIFRRKN